MSRQKLPIDEKSLGGRIEAGIEALGTTRVKFSKISGISTNYLSQIITGVKSPSDRTIKLIADRLMINEDWLRSGKGQMGGPRVKTPVLIPVLGHVPAGFPDETQVKENTIDYVLLPDAPHGVYALVVHGDSMAPALHDGDYVLFTPDSAHVHNGDIIVVNNEWGETVLKRYRTKEGKHLLTSDNPDYPMIEPNEHYRIIGKVVKAWRPLKL